MMEKGKIVKSLTTAQPVQLADIKDLPGKG
jgi:hypothetical protein